MNKDYVSLIIRKIASGFVDLRRHEQAHSAIETALILPVLALLLVGAVDFGRGYYLAIEVAGSAESGALYGSQNWSDITGMQTAATLDAGDVSALSAIGNYGCECSDGSSVSVGCVSVPTCAVNIVNYVEVRTAAAYKPMLPYPGLPAVFALNGYSRMRAGH